MGIRCVGDIGMLDLIYFRHHTEPKGKAVTA